MTDKYALTQKGTGNGDTTPPHLIFLEIRFLVESAWHICDQNGQFRGAD
jgi:hypothetical protein